MLEVTGTLDSNLTLSFVVWLQALEKSLDSLALTSFGVMDTTLEEVFLKVSEEDQSLENSDAGEIMPPTTTTCLQIAQHLHYNVFNS